LRPKKLELISIESRSEALNVLHGVIASKKNKQWSTVIEELMKKHLTLSVELRKGKIAKEALHQYRSTYPNNLASLENVIRVYLKEADTRASQAQAKADKVVLDVEDLEAEDGTEGPVFLTSIIGEDRKDRADRELVTPWLRFLWESYRIVLDILKNNKLEALYHVNFQNPNSSGHCPTSIAILPQI
jgi:translation initiation factor 3 subunit A